MSLWYKVSGRALITRLLSKIYEFGLKFVDFSSSRVQELLVLETAVVSAATQEALQTHSIPAMVSKDLLDMLEGRETLIKVAEVSSSSSEATAENVTEVKVEVVTAE